MQSRSKPLDDLTNLFTNAAGAVKGVGDEMKAMGRAQAEKLIAEMDLVTRDEFDVLKEMLEAQREESEKLKKKVASLERAVKKLKG